MQQDGRHNVQAGIFGGTPQMVAWWTDAYYELVNQTVTAKKFAGKEQDLMTNLLYQYPERFWVLQSDGEWRRQALVRLDVSASPLSWPFLSLKPQTRPSGTLGFSLSLFWLQPRISTLILI